MSAAEAMREHRVPVPDTTGASSSATVGAGVSYWYPLHRLARFSGAVATADATPDEVKRAMAEAKAAISVDCRQRGVPLEVAYRKIGATVCVSEAGFTRAVDAWASTRTRASPENTSDHDDQRQRLLQTFVSQLEETRRRIFHDADSDAPTTAATEASSAADIELPEDLRAQLAQQETLTAAVDASTTTDKRRLSASRPAAASSAAKPASSIAAVAAVAVPSVAPSQALPASPPAAPPAVPSQAIRHLLSKYAAPPVPSTATNDEAIAAATGTSASLAAPAGRFSLAAFLDQHLQPASRGHAAARIPPHGAGLTLGQAQSDALERTRRDLEALTAKWQADLARLRHTNPPIVRVEQQRVAHCLTQLEQLEQRHAQTRALLHAHVGDASAAMRAQVDQLQRNMAFLQHVREYEQLWRQANDLSERCREELSSASTAAAEPGKGKPTKADELKQQSSAKKGDTTTTTGTGVDAGNVQGLCVMFLKLMRLYQGLRDATPNLAAGEAATSSSSSSSTGGRVAHLESLVRQRLLTILGPLQSRLVHLYRETLRALNWPQTTHTLLLGLHANPLAAGARMAKDGSGAASATGDLTSSSSSSSSGGGGKLTAASSSSSSSTSPPSLDASLRLFELLTENLIRVQILLVECGMAREVRRVEREIEGGRTDHDDDAADADASGLSDADEDGSGEDQEEKKDERKTSSSKSKPPLGGTRLWVLTLLLQPLYTRFYYHFDSTPPTIGGGGDEPSSMTMALTMGAQGASGGGVTDPASAADSATSAAAASSSTAAASAAAAAAAGSSSSSSSSTGGVLTNRLDKPAWVCTFLERSFVDHRDFLERLVQPIVNACRWRKAYEMPIEPAGDGKSFGVHPASSYSSLDGGGLYYYGNYDVCLEFLERLLSFYRAKLARPSTMRLVTASPALLRLTLGELIAFEAKLSGLYAYPIESNRRRSLVEPFLLQPEAFHALVREEKETVNRGFDRLRKLEHPWDPVLTSPHGDGFGGAATTADAADDAGEEEGEDASEDPSDAASFLLHSSSSSSSSSATHSAHAFLSLVDRLTGRYRAYKYLNARLVCLKEVQFKLFEIYEEDLIREFQENWTRLQENARRGGVAKLTIDHRPTTNDHEEEEDDQARSSASSGSGGIGGRSSKGGVSNPLPLWQKHCGLANSIAYICGVLREWDDQVVFLELYYFYTHKAKIQASFLAAHKAAAHRRTTTRRGRANKKSSDGSSGGSSSSDPVVPIGGVLVTHPHGEEEVMLTSEELAVWMANGGQATTTIIRGPPPRPNAPAHAAGRPATTTNTPDRSSAEEPTATTSAAASLLPVEFRRTLVEFGALAKLANVSTTATATATGASPAPQQLVRSSSSRSSTVDASPSSSSSSTLPLDLTISGTLFSPILAGYSALLSEMLHSLSSQVVAHFRDALKATGYRDEGHMTRRTTFDHPELRIDRRDVGRPLFEWATLDHLVDLSPTICQPLVDLQMQLLVVRRHLTASLHRTFWTSVAARLSQGLFDDLVAGKFFSRPGALQFMRDMRAVMALFSVYPGGGGGGAPSSSSSSSAGASACAGPLVNVHFKLVQDTLNLLLLSRAQLAALDLELTAGSVASSSASAMRSYLAKEPYLLQKMTPNQVVDVIAHMRVDEEEEEAETEAEAEEAEAEAEAEEEEHEPEEEYEPEKEEADVEQEEQHHHQQQEEQDHEEEDQEASADAGAQHEYAENNDHEQQEPSAADQAQPQHIFDAAAEEDEGEPELNLDDFEGFPDGDADASEEAPPTEQLQPDAVDDGYDLR